MHTPGPWTRKRPIPEDATVSRLVFAGDDLIATVHDLEDASQEAIANARLIAAAPLMLDALRVVVDSWTSQFERNGHLAPAWCKQARAAIEAATKE